MAVVLRLTVLTGPHKNAKYCFRGSCRCVIGRASNCFVQLAGTGRDGFVSNHHCELIFEPPLLIFNDLVSLNGTYLNGIKLESRTLMLAGSNNSDCAHPVFNQGDLLTVGGTTFRMDIVDCPPKEVGALPVWESGETAKRGCPVPCS